MRHLKPNWVAGAITIEALKERESLAELSKRFEVQPNMISNQVAGRWKQEFLENSSAAFKKEKDTSQEADTEKLYMPVLAGWSWRKNF